MGAWASGPFDNDDAQDVLQDVLEMTADEATAALDTMMAAVLDQNGYLEAPDMSAAIGAACIVAISHGAPDAEPDLDEWRMESGFAPDQSMVARAAQVLARAAEPVDNEWYDLWDEPGRLEEPLTALLPYRQALTRRM